ncbi:MAG: hypothetical protein KDA61_14385, partial [Planctomycetales bacterium]|nr:hypothetical protein [Planctomycetales bacterium]
MNEASDPAGKAGDLILEVCVGSLDDAVAARDAGADRLELCGALELGGLTPSCGLIEQVCGEVDLPTVVMLRPRAGGFCYSEGEFDTMLRDAELALARGAAGVVCGMLDARSEICTQQVSRVVELAGHRDVVFHRAFDMTRDVLASLDVLINLGVQRVLTTGGPPSAWLGAQTLAALVGRANGRIEVMP